MRRRKSRGTHGARRLLPPRHGKKDPEEMGRSAALCPARGARRSKKDRHRDFRSDGTFAYGFNNPRGGLSLVSYQTPI